MHTSDSTFLAPYLHKFSAVVQIVHFLGAIWEKFGFNLVLLLVGSNLVSNISTKASKTASNVMLDIIIIFGAIKVKDIFATT